MRIGKALTMSEADTEPIPDGPRQASASLRSPAPYRYLFGPLPSRRFGRSLGIDLVPMKTCPLNCRFCQLGPTDTTRVERREYVPTEALLAELADWYGRDGQADVLTLAGSGEPTLHTGFGHILNWIRDHTGLPSLLLSNGALFADPAVREAAAGASVVKVALHAWDAASFARISRPHPGIDFNAMVAGYRAFRARFTGSLVIEVFVMPGINDTPEAMHRIAALTAAIRPDRIDLNTAVRPCADTSVRPVDAVELLRLADCFDPPAQLPGDAPALSAAPSDSQLVELLRRHPCDADSLARFFTLSGSELQRRLTSLADAGRLRYDGHSACWVAQPASESGDGKRAEGLKPFKSCCPARRQSRGPAS